MKPRHLSKTPFAFVAIFVSLLTLIVSGCGGSSFAFRQQLPHESQRYDQQVTLYTQLVDIERVAPDGGSVNEEIPLEIHVYAREDVSDVVVRNTVSSNVEILRTEPEATVVDHTLTWRIATMDCDEELVLTVWVKATSPGDIVDSVTVQALPRVCVAVPIGQCNLCITKKGPERLCLGDTGIYTVVVSNNGTAASKDVVVKDLIPDGMVHVSGESELYWELGNLAAGSDQVLTVCLEAASPGTHCNTAIASAANAPDAEATTCTLVEVANLEVSCSSLSEATVGNSAAINITVNNTGNVILYDLNIMSHILGFNTIVSADGGEAFEDGGSWHIDSLNVGDSKTVSLVIQCSCPSTAYSNITAQAYSEHCGNVAESAHCSLVWKGQPGLLLEMIDTCDPMLVAEEGLYRIRITNEGTAADTNVWLTVTFPYQLEPLSISGDTEGEIEGRTVTFHPLYELQAGDYVEYNVEARATAKGDAQVTVEMQADSLTEPVFQEENTFIY